MKKGIRKKSHGKRRAALGPLKIGLTGGIGAGKSVVLDLIGQKGIPVLKTDEVARRLLEKGTTRDRIVRRFGRGILDPAGKIERARLAALAFADRKKQEALNRILHPGVRREVSAWIRAQRPGSPGRMVVVEVPLLFERGYYRFFDGILSVSAAKPLRHKRLLKRGWNRHEIGRRDRLQWSQARKDQWADWVIFNNGTRSGLRRKVDVWMGGFDPVKAR